jgi:hypothetical protein
MKSISLSLKNVAEKLEEKEQVYSWEMKIYPFPCNNKTPIFKTSYSSNMNEIFDLIENWKFWFVQ